MSFPVRETFGGHIAKRLPHDAPGSTAPTASTVHQNSTNSGPLQALEVLDLSDNCFKNDEVSEVALVFLQRWRTQNCPEKHSSSRNDYDRNARAWREAIGTGTALRDVRSVGKCFQRLPALRELNLSGNLVSAKGMSVLLESVIGTTLGSEQVTRNARRSEGGGCLGAVEPHVAPDFLGAEDSQEDPQQDNSVVVNGIQSDEHVWRVRIEEESVFAARLASTAIALRSLLEGS